MVFMSKINDNYRLYDTVGNECVVTAEDFKLLSNKYFVERVSDTLEPCDLNKKSNENKMDITPAEIMVLGKEISGEFSQMGMPVVNHSYVHGYRYYLYSKSNTEYIVYIPDDVLVLHHLVAFHESTSPFYKFGGKIAKLKVIGGSSLVDASSLFSDCKIEFLDLSSFNTSKVENMSYMFCQCEAQAIDLSSFNTNNVKDMRHMFYKCKTPSLDLSSFNTSNVEYIDHIFCECEAQSIDLSSFNTNKVEDMGYMFYGCKAKILDLTSFYTSQVKSMDSMFERCEAEYIDLSSFVIKDKPKNRMFINMDISMDCMFYGCKAKIKATNQRILECLR